MNDILCLRMDEAINIINENTDFILSSHINPDGDSIGSVLSLALALIKKGKNVKIIIDDSIPMEYQFLPGVNMIEGTQPIHDNISVIITLDSSDPDRLGEGKSILNTSNKTINIDHHISNTKYCDINIVDSNASATGEIIYEFINRMGIVIDKDIATNIYTSINTDTGSFKYENVTSKTHRIIANLMDIGINPADINNKLYENISLNRIHLFIKALNTMKLYNNNQVVLVKVTQDMLKDTNAGWEDTEGIVSYIRKIKGVEVACLLKEIKNEEIKISIRSKEYVDVSSLCDTFGGGGHVRAAGCTICSTIETAERLIINRVKDELR